MWLIFALLALFAYASADILGKKAVNAGTETTPLEMLISVEVLSVVISAVLFVSGAGESGEAPWQILLSHPLILANFVCFVLYWLLYLLSMRYIGLSMIEAVGGAGGVFFFIGLVVINLVTGRLADVAELLHSWKLIPILLVLIFTVLLPNVELLADKATGKPLAASRKERKKTIFGLALLLIGIAFDSVDSLVVTILFDSGEVGLVDYLMASYFLMILPAILLSVILFIKNRKVYIPFQGSGTHIFSYSCAALLATVVYLYASNFDAVKTGIVFIAYPVIPILGAKLILKETYSWRQNLCIWVIAASSILFCIADYFP